MRVGTFQAIRFSEKFWNSAHSGIFDNSDTTSKIQKTGDVIPFLNEQITRGVAKIDSQPGLYVLRITANEKSVTSIIGEVGYDEHTTFLVNEDIHREKLEYYKKMFTQYRLQTNPILTFYQGSRLISSMVGDIQQASPTSEAFINGAHYELWHVNKRESVESIRSSLGKIDKLYIADGHHRFSVFKSGIPGAAAKLIVSITDASSVILKSCHKVVIGDVAQNWVAKISGVADVRRLPKLEYRRDGIIAIFKSGERFLLVPKQSGRNIYDVVKSDIIRGAFGIQDYKNRVFPLPGNIRFEDIERIFDLYLNGSVILFVPSIDISEFFKTIDAGNTLPATSTWFEPKIIDGFITRKF